MRRERPIAVGLCASEALDRFLAASRPTRCELVKPNGSGPSVGEPYGKNEAISSAYLVRNGFALDYVKYGHGESAQGGGKRRAREGRAVER